MISNTIMAGPALSLALGAQRVANLFKSDKAADKPTERTRYTEAEALREYAQRYVDRDPGFASDLFAAADRHEGINAD